MYTGFRPNPAGGAQRPWRVEPEEVLALAKKYRALARLRKNAPEPANRVRKAMRELARGFPGALRELDCLPLGEIDARQEVLEEAVNLCRSEPWMSWMASYHHVLRRIQEARLTRCPLLEVLEDDLGVACLGDELLGWLVQKPGAGTSRRVRAVLSHYHGLSAGSLDALLFEPWASGGATFDSGETQGG